MVIFAHLCIFCIVSCLGKNKQQWWGGIGWLIPREAALGALCCEQFQLMPDPLAGVKKEDMFMVVSVLFSYSTMYNVDIVETRKKFNTTV